MITTTEIDFGYKSDVGRRRDTNEDSCAVLNRQQLNGALDALMIVADGLGGRRAGELASRILVETVSMGVLESTSTSVRPLDSGDIEQLLQDTIVRANGNIMTQGRYHERNDARGMATTCVSAIIHHRAVSIGHVGDSRLYLLRSGEIKQITADHSEVFAEFAKGNLTEDEARNHRFRNQITRAVGLEREVKPDILTVPLNAGDSLLLCTDGLTTELPDETIGAILAGAPSAQEACNLLVTAALRRGGRDNITVVVMRYGDFTPTASFDAATCLLDEPDTDPDQDWRSDARSDDSPGWADDDRELRNDRAAYAQAPRPLRPGSPAARVAQYAVAVIGLLVLGVLVEGAFIYNLHHQLVAQPPQPPPVTGQPLPVQALAQSYDAPQLVMQTRIMPDILQLSPQGNPIIATLDGQPQTVLIKQHKLLPMRGLIPSLPHAHTQPKAMGKSHADIYSDASGNFYYLNPDSQCIETYTATGTRTNQDLGKGALTAPTKLIVDPSGAIYVIDNYQLKVISPKLVTGGSAHPADADY